MTLDKVPPFQRRVLLPPKQALDVDGIGLPLPDDFDLDELILNVGARLAADLNVTP